jgi:molybdopterin molybdotransferase
MKEGIFLEEAVKLIKERAVGITQTEIRGIAEAGGYCLAEDVFAELDNPPFSRSPVDGYAVRAQDLKGASREYPVKLRVIACIYAGDDGEALKVSEGEAVRIMTGAPFPRGCDTAVRQEDTDYGEETVEVYREQKPFDNYCCRGEDYKKGSLLVAEHTRLTFAEQGILAGNGCEKVRVFRKPAIRVFTTGDELTPAGGALEPGKIYDSNGMMVSSRIRELGVVPKTVTHLSDSAAGVAEALKEASRDADVIVTTGGVSVGKKDILHEALALLGAEKIFWRVRIQPGTPTIFSVYKNTLILSLSGNPFGAMANVELLLRPMLETLTGDSIYAMEKREGIFKCEFPKTSHGRRFVRAIYRDGSVYLPEGIFSSGAIGTLRGCNCLLDIPAGSPGLKKGERVTVWML